MKKIVNVFGRDDKTREREGGKRERERKIYIEREGERKRE